MCGWGEKRLKKAYTSGCQSLFTCHMVHMPENNRKIEKAGKIQIKQKRVDNLEKYKYEKRKYEKKGS